MNISQDRVCDIRLNSGDIELDVEISSFLLENNILHGINEHLVASHEQLAFMVALEPDQVYVPCSDEIFFELMKDELSPFIRKEYARAWRANMRLLASFDLDKTMRARIQGFCRKRMEQVLAFHKVLPSRLIKRLTSVVLSPREVASDPWIGHKELETAFQERLLATPQIRDLVDELPDSVRADSIRDMRQELNRIEFSRLASLAVHAPAWKAREVPDQESLRRIFAGAEEAFGRVWSHMPGLRGHNATILLLCDAEGGAIYDLALARFFSQRGHRVVYAVKDDFYFEAPTLRDVDEDPALQRALQGALVCKEPDLSKNELLKLLREWRLIVIGDGTRERLNLQRVNVTFSRAWKEADLILAHGWRLWETLLGTSHSFTRDILCWKKADSGDGVEVCFKPHAGNVRKFSESDIHRLADGIIEKMREAHNAGRPVVFYSCVIGSIPGQTGTALRLATVIVDDIQKRLPNAFIINPARHFVEGMDGDDLMYMWERVQRSGFISLWFFQTTEDIERGFRLLGEDMPQAWIGKDATYSTGCTKEMRIALEMQKRYPEMQIQGPDPSSFFRRGEYGVGKYFDARLVRR